MRGETMNPYQSPPTEQDPPDQDPDQPGPERHNLGMIIVAIVFGLWLIGEAVRSAIIR